MAERSIADLYRALLEALDAYEQGVAAEIDKIVTTAKQAKRAPLRAERKAYIMRQYFLDRASEVRSLVGAINCSIKTGHMLLDGQEPWVVNSGRTLPSKTMFETSL